MVLTPITLAKPGKLLEKHISRPHLRIIESETLGVAPAVCIYLAPGDPDILYRWTAVAVECFSQNSPIVESPY